MNDAELYRAYKNLYFGASRSNNELNELTQEIILTQDAVIEKLQKEAREITTKNINLTFRIKELESLVPSELKEDQANE